MELKRFRQFKLAAIAAIALGNACAFAQAIKTSVGDLHIAADAVSDTVFRISVNANAKGDASPRQSIYLDPSHPLTPTGQVGSTGNQQSIKTAAGELRIDGSAGTYTLLNAKGDVLVPPAPIATVTENVDHPAIDVHIGWPDGKPFDIYGCGNGNDGLVQREVKTRVGNGEAIQPFFWAPAGFASFFVSADDNAPGTCDGKIDQGAVSWHARGSTADLYLIVAPTLVDATKTLLDLTGHPPVPPRWTFGYMQSQWGWQNRAYIDDVLKQFTDRKIPVDAFIFDFEWYTTFPDYQVKPAGVAGFSDFNWNDRLFPQPAEQLKQLHDAGVKFVGIRKPRLGNSDTLDMIRSKGWGFKSASNIDTRGLWFANPEVRAWYAQQITPLLKAGVDGWWNDEREFTYTNYLYWNQAEHDALAAVDPTARLWSLNRAFQPGTSRYGAAAWTGDIRASWHDLERTPAALLNWSLAGMPFDACDIGGFGGQTTPELLTRWIEAGTFFPVMRTHSEVMVQPHFPWLFGDKEEAAMRQAIDLRMQLVPLLYSLAHQTYRTGEPIVQPLAMEFPSDPATADLTSEWLVGKGLLAAPVLQKGKTTRSVYLPGDTWYDFATGEKIVGPKTLDVTANLDQVPVRTGTILPLGPVIQHTRDLPGGPLELQIYPGHDASFTLVEDDGTTTAYQKGGDRETTFVWNDAKQELTWSRTGSYAGADVFTSIKPVLKGGTAAPAPEQPLNATGRARFGR